MLLHEHSINAQREKQGLAPANSIWFSHGGTFPPRRRNGSTVRTFSSPGIATALAAFVGSPAERVPGRLDDVIEDRIASASTVIVLPSSLDWDTVDQSWATPARKALDSGRLREVSLLVDDRGEAVIWQAQRRGFWKRVAARHAQQDLSALLAAARAP